jgi:cytochrome P450
VQRRLVADPDDDAYLDAVLDEALRAYPLFGIAHRITTADIHTPHTTITAGSVLCFSYPEYHRAGYPDPDVFDPDRWQQLAARDANFIPFGVTGNRACPARGLAPVTMKVVAREVLRRYHLSSSAAHTRSAPNRGPCLLTPRPSTPEESEVEGSRRVLVLLRLRDRWEDVSRSLAQLAFGTYMVLDARRKALCVNYFAEHPEAAPVTQGSDR